MNRNLTQKQPDTLIFLQEELEDVSIPFFNKVLADYYDYCVLGDELIYGMFLMLKEHILNKHNIPIYTKNKIETSLSIELENKSILILFNSIESFEVWEDTYKKFILFLKDKIKPSNLAVRAISINQDDLDKISSDFNDIMSKPVSQRTYNNTKTFSLDKQHSNLDPLNIDTIFDQDFAFPLNFLFFSIFESDFIPADDYEAIIVTDKTLYFALLHFLHIGKVTNKNEKPIMFFSELNEEYNQSIISKSTVITLVSCDKTINTNITENLKQQIFKINPNLSERDIYHEDLVHF